MDIVDAVLDEYKINPIRSHCTYQNMPRNTLFAYCSFLTGMAADSGGDVIDIGTDVGMSALAFAFGTTLVNSPPPPVYSFDIRPECLTFTENIAKKLGLKHLHLNLGTSHDASKYVKSNDLGIGYIDGEHDFSWCYTDLNNLYHLLAPFGKLLLHDFPTPLKGWEDKIHFNGVGHACLCFSEAHKDMSFSYLGASWICGSKHHPKAWDTEKAKSFSARKLL